jgi:hypothetical protein
MHVQTFEKTFKNEFSFEKNMKNKINFKVWLITQFGIILIYLIFDNLCYQRPYIDYIKYIKYVNFRNMRNIIMIKIENYYKYNL